jgi:hypothetical protein
MAPLAAVGGLESGLGTGHTRRAPARMEAMRCLGALLSLGVCLAAMPARAEPDTFGLGNGQHGALMVQQLNTSINLATPLTASVSAGSKALTVADATGFAAGELVLILQLSSSGPAPDASPAVPLELAPLDAGRWELARLESMAPGQLNLTAPLVSAFAVSGTQVVRVPEYTSVHVRSATSLVAPPWNGSSGGVLAFLATQAVLNQGLISAEGAGFRGGTFVLGSSGSTGCMELNQSQQTGGSQKGEGLFSTSPGAHTHGYGALAQGAGGGNCDDGGGGGGGHGGAGGKGGFTASSDGSRDVGGRGGQALSYAPLTRLMFGGGGGAGAGDSNGSGNGRGSSGAAGGGIIYVRAQDFQGSQGRIVASGSSAPGAPHAGAGGGGAGGFISLRVEGRLDCAGAEANGGNGGDDQESKLHGPGGGGGGGVVLLQGQMMTCTASVLPGVAGTLPGSLGGTSYGATPTTAAQPESQGMTTSVSEPFALPAVPHWVTPAEGEASGPRPQLEGTGQPGSTVQVVLNGQVLGSVEVSAAGSFTLPLSADLAPGPYQLSATAERLGVRSAPSEPRAFTVTLTEPGPGSPLALKVGCGCGASEAAGGLWLFAWGGLLLGATRRRFRGG